MTGFKPGWAHPVNAVDGLAHWWTPKNRKACDPDSLTGYSGPTLKTLTTPYNNLCLECVETVIQATNVIGNPT